MILAFSLIPNSLEIIPLAWFNAPSTVERQWGLSMPITFRVASLIPDLILNFSAVSVCSSFSTDNTW